MWFNVYKWWSCYFKRYFYIIRVLGLTVLNNLVMFTKELIYTLVNNC